MFNISSRFFTVAGCLTFITFQATASTLVEETQVNHRNSPMSKLPKSTGVPEEEDYIRIELSSPKRDITDIRMLLKASKESTHVDISNNALNDDALKVVSEFPFLQYMSLNDNCFTDDGAKFLRKFNNLRETDISRNYITNVGISYLPLNNLKILHANFLQLGNEAIQKLSLGSKIAHLSVKGTGIDEDALPYFQQMTALKLLDISYNKVGSAALKKLASTRPDVKIIADYMVE